MSASSTSSKARAGSSSGKARYSEYCEPEHRSGPVPGWYFRLVRWRLRNVSDRVLIVTLAVVTGVLTGAVAWLMRLLIDVVSRLVLRLIRQGQPNVVYLVLPVVGIFLAAVLQRYIARDNMTHSEPRLLAIFRRGRFRLKWHLTWGSLIGCPLTLGFGGSSGGACPTALAGAAYGSTFCRLLGCRKAVMRTIVACGAGSGIAGIFTAPVSGVLFVVEVLRAALPSLAMILLFISCVCAACTSYLLTGGTISLTFLVDKTPEMSLFWIFVVFGVVCGLYSSYYKFLIGVSDVWIQGIPGMWRPVLSGLMLGGIVFIFPALFGEGNDVIRHLEGNGADYGFLTDTSFYFSLHTMGKPLLLLIGALLLLKALAVNLTNSGGGVAGIFTPAMMAGALLGTFFAQMSNLTFGTGLSLPLFALLGVAGVMAGVLRAPLLGTFVAIEVSGCYLLIIPVALVAFASYLTRMKVAPRDVIMSPKRLIPL